MGLKLTVRASEIATLLDRAPPGVRVLSLDCFDTLIWRTTHSPRDVFATLDIPGGGVEVRGWSEGASSKARQAQGDGSETTLQDIYRHLYPNIDAAGIEARITQELAQEAAHALAFAPTVALMRAAKARGLSIAIVSDMYLTEAQLRAHIAAAAGDDVLAMIDHVFVSAAHGVGKGAGLFDVVLDTLKVQAAEILHVGDNALADYEAAALRGLHAVHFRQFDSDSERRLRQEAACAVMIDPRIRVTDPAYQPHRAAVALRIDDDPAYVLGHDVLGPVVHTFSLWLKDEIDRWSADIGRPVRPVFMMRDGHLPMRAFSALFPDIDVQPVEISRFVATRVGIHDLASLDAYIDEFIQDLPNAVIARQLMLFAPEVARFAKGGDTPDNRAAFARFLRKPETQTKIVKRTRDFTTKVIAHLAKAGVAEGDAVMLIDIGYNGSAQNSIEPVLRERLGLAIAGRYMFLREGQMTGLDKRGMLDTRHYDCRTLHALTGSVSILEQLCNVERGSTTDFTPDGTPIRDQCDVKSTRSAIRTIAQDACMDFVRHANAGIHHMPSSLTLMARVQAAAAAMTRLMFLPNAREIALFAQFDHDVNLGSAQLDPMFDAVAADRDMRRLGMSYVNHKQSLYLAGEVQPKGLPLSMLMLTSLRFGLDLRSDDFQVGGIEVPVMLLGGSDQGVMPMTAWPTIDGYYRLTVPVGAAQFVPGVQLGAICEMVQIDSIGFQRVADIDSATMWRPQDTRPVLDEMDEVGTGVFRAGEGALVMVPPPPSRDPLALVLVFRPLVLRRHAVSEGGQVVPARQAA